MTLLRVDGARLYYEVRGKGPLLLLIPGGNGDAGPYAPVAAALADRFTVITYDRRGFTRSPLDAGTDPSNGQLEADVTDAIALIDEVGGGDARAYVFGSSSGAIVALHLLATHPDRLVKVVAHEPPLVGLLDAADDWPGFFDEVVAEYHADGQDAAMATFGARLGEPERPPMDIGQLPPPVVEMMERMHANQRFWLENELRQYPVRTPDITALAAHTEKLVLAGGGESRGLMPYQPNLVLADLLGLTVIDFPGGHIGYVTAREVFSPVLAQVLDATAGAAG
jgi:pimeloyl-ACP methyl ester carboxylesterase